MPGILKNEPSQPSRKSPLSGMKTVSSKVIDCVSDNEVLNNSASNEKDLDAISEHYWTLPGPMNGLITSVNKANFMLSKSRSRMTVFLWIICEFSLLFSSLLDIINSQIESSTEPKYLMSTMISSMEKDVFEQIFQCLHIRINMAIDKDRFYDIRHIFEHLNITAQINMQRNDLVLTK
ncbi:unnamed protein product [Lepeophtheirus salmonis]|uniref:(salmon louse) hypothetical protein n=1 Tax=Lepeophtheirus salmonis TaxID=72036 RepID=A0A7R8H1B6_LEPSM|nr:unnamed protein product [Lepeophtheirus salmonis]CAF2808336.1 unnamed protein product [Lepeophtheirus salmonis]